MGCRILPFPSFFFCLLCCRPPFHASLFRSLNALHCLYSTPLLLSFSFSCLSHFCPIGVGGGCQSRTGPGCPGTQRSSQAECQGAYCSDHPPAERDDHRLRSPYVYDWTLHCQVQIHLNAHSRCYHCVQIRMLKLRRARPGDQVRLATSHHLRKNRQRQSSMFCLAWQTSPALKASLRTRPRRSRRPVHPNPRPLAMATA